MHSIVPLVFCTLILLPICVYGVAPSAISSTVKVKDFQLLGADLNLATYTFTFDQDLYLHKSNYCPAYNCSSGSVSHSDQNSCVCDFASTATCGTGFQVANSAASCSCDHLNPSPCNTNVYDWTNVALTSGSSQTLRTELKAGETKHWRVFVNSTCKGFRTFVNTVYGISSLYVSNKDVANAKNSHWKTTNAYQKEEAFICPTDVHFIQGTYFIAVLASTDTIFDLVIEDIFVAPPSTPEPEKCTSDNPYPWLSGAECLYDSVPATFVNFYNFGMNPPTYRYNVTFTNGTCTPVFIAIQEYFASFGTTTSFSVSFPRHGNATKYSSYDRESFIICPKNGESWTPIQISIATSASYLCNYRLTVSSGYFTNHWSHVPLASIPTYEVNFDLLGTASVNTYPYPVDIAMTIGSTGHFELAGKYVLTCTDWKADCKALSFATNDNPLFPVPPLVLNLPGVGDLFHTVKGNYSIPVPAATSKSYSVVVLLSYETNTFVENIPTSGIDEISVEFHGKIGNLAGEVLQGNFTATLAPGSCNNSKFQESTSAIEDILDDLSSASSLIEINTLRYKLDSTSFQDDFAFCREFVDDLTVGVTTQNFNITSFYCPYESNTFAWFYDPCCNQAAVWLSTCFPRNSTGPLPQFGVQTEAVEQVCKNVDCSQSYLEDYSSAKSAFESGQCSVDLNESKLLKEQAQKQYLACKRQAFPFAAQPCLSDSDCHYYYDNTTYTCSLRTGTCLVPYRTMETAFIACLGSYLNEAQESLLEAKYNFTHEQDGDLQQLWLGAVSSTDCVEYYGSSPNLNHRQKVLTVPVDFDCAVAYSCDSYECEDNSCPYPDLTCHYTCGIEKSFEPSSETECKAEYVCNWDSDLCDGEDSATCATLCSTQPSQSHFCGFCDSFDDCVEFTELTTPQSCASTSVCLLSNGTYFFNLTDSQCDNLQRCDLDSCGHTCSATTPTYSSGICFSYELNSTSCTGNGGQWMNNTGGSFSSNLEICVYAGATTNTTCAAFAGASWEACGDLSLYDCAQCTGTSCPQLTQNLMKCRIVGKPCSDATTCTNSGICSDSEYFLDMTSPTQRYGGCVMSRFPPGDVTSFPYCPAGYTSVPAACMWNPSIAFDVASCDQLEQFIPIPMDWTLPSEDEATCLAPKACKEIFYDQERYSPKDEGNCTSEFTGDEWASKYEWTSGRWVGGVKRNLAWTQRQAYPKYQWNITIDYIQLEDDFLESALQETVLGSKSAALCQYQRTLVPMQAVTCDCTDSGSSQCFAADPVQSIAQTQVCADSAETEFYAGLRLTYYNDTVDLGCSNVLISKISMRTFASAKKEKLLANFIPFAEKDIPEFPVYNERGAVVGKILTDGVTLTPLASTSLGEFELCMQLQSVQKKTATNQYPVFDFAATDNDGSLTDDGQQERLTPLRLDAYEVIVAQSSVYDGKYLCAKISNVTSEQSFFPIERKLNFEDEEKEVLSPTGFALSYTLAAMFLAASAVSTVQLIYYVYSYFFKNLPLVLEHFLVTFIWLFVAVRTVYFFLVANGLDSQVADYILVALPTFFYFTAFSIIVVLWAVVASKRFTNDVAAFKKLINRATFGINVVLYAIFVALVLAFQFAKSTSESPCSGRQDAKDNSSELKQSISIAYGLIIAIISLIIGILFVVFGLRIRKFISMSQTHEKIFIVTAICSGCFILHSVFIVVVSFLNTPNLYFSFFGLIITEWFPAIFIITWLFIQRTSSKMTSTEKMSKSTDGKRMSTPSTRSTAGVSSTRSRGSGFTDSVELPQLDADH